MKKILTVLSISIIVFALGFFLSQYLTYGIICKPGDTPWRGPRREGPYYCCPRGMICE